jgi:hypothetical protein
MLTDCDSLAQSSRANNRGHSSPDEHTHLYAARRCIWSTRDHESRVETVISLFSIHVEISAIFVDLCRRQFALLPQGSPDGFRMHPCRACADEFRGLFDDASLELLLRSAYNEIITVWARSITAYA